jgi:Zn-dependent peptidase ImmA (M78 family)
MPRVMASATPAVLRWARESHGLDIATAAKRIGVKENVLLAAETRTGALTFAQLTKAASVYKRALAVFLLPKPPSETQIVADFRRAVGAAPSLSPELRFELRRMTRKREIAVQLQLRGTEPSDAQDVPLDEWAFVGSLRGNEDPIAVGKQLRKRLGVTAEARKEWRDDFKTFNWWRARVENVGPFVFLVSHIDVAEMRGFSIARKPFPMIVLNRADSPRARLFSLIHELTHVYLGNSGLCDLSEDGPPNVDANIEVFCNAVAAETLMPREQVTSHATVRAHKRGVIWTDTELRAVAGDFGVSDDAMLYRLVKLNLATSERSRTLRPDERDPPELHRLRARDRAEVVTRVWLAFVDPTQQLVSRVRSERG